MVVVILNAVKDLIGLVLVQVTQRGKGSQQGTGPGTEYMKDTFWLSLLVTIRFRC
jgi:hypothetical protein